MIPAQKSLISKFLLTTLLLGFSFAFIHLLIPPDSDNLFQYYALIVITAGALVYLVYFRNSISKADFKGDGKYYLIHIYFPGACLVPAWFIYLAEYSSKNEVNFSDPDFLIYNGIFLSIYALLLFLFWIMVKNGNDEWNLNDYY